MLDALGGHDLAWERVHVFQVDERVAPDGHPDRNLELLRNHLLAHVALPTHQLHPMPVTDTTSTPPATATPPSSRRSAANPRSTWSTLAWAATATPPPCCPQTPSSDEDEDDVAVTGPYQGRRRMTLTVPALNRARRLLWLVEGHDKRAALRGLLAGEPTIPATRLRRDRALVLTDVATDQAPPP